MSKELQKTGEAGIQTINQYGSRSSFIAHAENVTNIYMAQNSDERDENGRPLTPLVPTRYDKNRHIIFLGNEEIKIPVELDSDALLDKTELPYIYALCETYAEKLNQVITPDNLDSLPEHYKKELNRHKQSYYGAEYVHHSMREVFSDGEQEFKNLKNDVYEGIETTYFDLSFANGYERLMAVLNKITTITLTGSNLTNVMGMITNLEKKGICHILVNDDVIKSWVHVDE